MPKPDPRVDAYIAKAQPFARPILEHVRRAVHAGCPQAVETLKWGMPYFEHQGLLCHMAAFKAHAAFGFWLGAKVTGESETSGSGREAMGQYGRLASVKDLPPLKRLAALVKKAAALNAQGVKSPTRAKDAPPKKEPPAPADLLTGLRKRKGAAAGFKALTASQRREYIEWVLGAKRAETRAKRIAATAEGAAEGKPMNWKYG
jgi:hypothetical protein